MVVGFNHNFRYNGQLYHVQTEDGGIRNPVIITHLFTGGTILASKKTSYADILKSDRLEQVVEELMKEQHREMLRRLRDGELDERLGVQRQAASGGAGKPAAAGTPSPGASPRPVAATSPVPASPPPPATPKPATAPMKAPAPVSKPAPPPPPAASRTGDTAPENSLDDIILSYLLGEGGKKP